MATVISQVWTIGKSLPKLLSATPRHIKWMLVPWSLTTLAILGWTSIKFGLQPLIQFWSAAPVLLRPFLVLWVILSFSIVVQWFFWSVRQQIQPIRIRAQRVLDDFSEYLSQQVVLHEREMEQIAQEIIARMPSSLGWSGEFYLKQIAAAKNRQREIRRRWKAASRQIQDLFMQVGVRGEDDHLIAPQLRTLTEQTAQEGERIREVCREFCLRGNRTYSFDEAWLSVPGIRGTGYLMKCSGTLLPESQHKIRQLRGDAHALG